MVRRNSRCVSPTQHANQLAVTSGLGQGSVFVEFADFQSVETFLNADPKPTWEDKELLIMSK